jgi:RHS repeat-associated protein
VNPALKVRVAIGYDGHGSVRSLTNSAGTITDTYDYDAFGNLTNSTGSTPNNYLFAGEQYDPALALYYNRARYLSTNTARFISMDPYEGDPQSPMSLHRYLYAGDEPASGADPSGLQLEEFGIAEAVEGVIAAISVQLVGAAAIAATSFAYLPHDAFLKPPSGKIAGLQGSYPIGKLLARYPKNPFLVGLAIGFQFTAGVGGIEILETQGSTQPWLYAVLGLSIGVSDGTQSLISGGNSPFNLNGIGFSAAYYGEAYNVKNPGDYAGPFYCVSASRGLGQFPGLPVGPSVSVCSSAPKEDGTTGAYSWSVSPLASKGFGVGTSILNYTYLFTLP